jgi:hypothetical protein
MTQAFHTVEMRLKARESSTYKFPCTLLKATIELACLDAQSGKKGFIRLLRVQS